MVGKLQAEYFPKLFGESGEQPLDVLADDRGGTPGV